MSDVEYAMQLRYDERETNAEEDHQSLMDELKNKVSSNITQIDRFHMLPKHHLGQDSMIHYVYDIFQF